MYFIKNNRYLKPMGLVSGVGFSRFRESSFRRAPAVGTANAAAHSTRRGYMAERGYMADLTLDYIEYGYARPAFSLYVVGCLKISERSTFPTTRNEIIVPNKTNVS